MKKLVRLFMLGLVILLGNIENANAQLLKRLENKVSQVTQTVNQISSKKSASTTEKLESKRQAQEIDYSDVYTIKSPYPEFKSIHIQAHKGLPRFGNQNPYYFKNEYGVIDMNRSKNNLLKTGYQNYGNLLTMHFLNTYYKEMDRSSLTIIDFNNRDNKKDWHSSVAQKHLLSTAYSLAEENSIRTFFCDVKNNSKCVMNSIPQWGGNRSVKDEFVEQEKYSTYVAEHLDNLLKWSKEFLKDGTESGYYVNSLDFQAANTPYDFDANGYWLSIFPNNSNNPIQGFRYYFTGDTAFFNAFLPVSNYGNKHLNRMTDVNSYLPRILLKINADTAEVLANKKLQHIYAATKVKILFKKLNERNVQAPKAEFTYHLVSPVIEFFEDIELTKKIGEIDLEKAVYKKRN